MTLPNATLFPQALLPLYIFEPRYRQMLADALHSNRMFSVAMQRPGNSRETRDSSLVIDHSHHAEWAALVARAMGARVVSRPDTSRYLDVTVLVGASWRPPAEAFHP